MKIYNKEKKKLINNPDLMKGKLIDDFLILDYVKEQTIEHKDESGKIIATEYIPEHYRREPIKVYIPYTDEELKELKEREYGIAVERLIRERYSVADEIALIRQQKEKPNEWETYNSFCEECKTKARQKLKGEKV